MPLVDMYGEKLAVPQLCAEILREARLSAQQAVGCSVERAVLTVPVGFDEVQRKLLVRAARLAHLEIVDVIEEPNAAALANASYDDFGGIIGIYDFGGGTFDFSLVDVSGGDFHILATAGDSWLGGDDFDQALASSVADLLSRKKNIDIRHRVVEWQHLLSSCENAKRSLSQQESARIHVPGVARNERGAVDLNMTVNRHRVEPLWRDLLDRSLVTCLQAMGMLDIAPSDLSCIYLSGGTTYIPAVRARLAELGVPVRTMVEPDAAVCLGAGIHAAQLERRLSPTIRWG